MTASGGRGGRNVPSAGKSRGTCTDAPLIVIGEDAHPSNGWMGDRQLFLGLASKRVAGKQLFDFNF
jgi:hypothetical protein